MKKQKLINKDSSIHFIDMISIKVSPDVNKNQDNQEQIIRRSKES